MQNTELKISEALAVLPKIDYRELNAFQGDFKTLSEVEFTKLRLNLFGDGAIPQFEFFVPIMVWFEPKSKKPYILDGHQRINVIKACNGTPHELPYIEVKAKNKIEAKKKLALFNSQYGKITRDGWDSFMHDVDLDFVRAFTTLEAFTLPPLEYEPVIINEQNLADFFVPTKDEDSHDIPSFKITLEYSEDDYLAVLEAFKKHSGTKENIVAKLLCQ